MSCFVTSCSRYWKLVFGEILIGASVLMLLDSLQLYKCSKSNRVQITPDKNGAVYQNSRDCHILLEVEILSIILNFVAASLCILSALSNRANAKFSTPKKFRIPFPYRFISTSNSVLAGYLEYACFLSSLVGLFGSLMYLTLTGLRIGRDYDQNRFESAEKSNHTEKYTMGESEQLIRINHFMQGVIAVCCNLFIIMLVTNSCIAFDKCVLNAETKPLNQHKHAFTFNQMPTTQDNPSHKLGRQILFLTSLLITSGGLVILGSLLKILSSSMFEPQSGESCNSGHPNTMLYIATGSFSVMMGTLCVITIQCCSVPLDLLQIDQINEKPYFLSSGVQHTMYMITLVFSFITIPCTVAIHQICKFQHEGPIYCHGAITRLKDMSFALILFPNNFSFYISTVLLSIMLMDFSLRLDSKRREQVSKTKVETPANLVQLNSVNSHYIECVRNPKHLPSRQSNSTCHSPYSCSIPYHEIVRFKGAPQGSNVDVAKMSSRMEIASHRQRSNTDGSNYKLTGLRNQVPIKISTPQSNIGYFYACNPHDVSKTEATQSPFDAYPGSRDVCEYMSCDLMAEQATSANSTVLIEPDYDPRLGKPVGYYYIDTASDDLITSV